MKLEHIDFRETFCFTDSFFWRGLKPLIFLDPKIFFCETKGFSGQYCI